METKRICLRARIRESTADQREQAEECAERIAVARFFFAFKNMIGAKARKER